MCLFKNKILRTEKSKSIISLMSLLVAILITAFANFYPVIFTKYLIYVVSILFLFSTFLISLISGYLVMKSLFKISAGLSLIVFLSQAYCGLPNISETGKDALQILMVFGILYLTFDFLTKLKLEIENKFGKLNKIKITKENRAFFTSVIIFIFIFISLLYKVIFPIIQDSCAFK